MSDTPDVQTSAPEEQDDGRKPFGRKQLIAIWGFAIPLIGVFAQSCTMLVTAVVRDGEGWEVVAGAAIDRFTSFSGTYVPTSMLVILGVAGGVQVVEAVSKAMAARKASA